ncbi:hypothetical protein [Nonomuraea dietziae]|uniref:luciferase domain-containing protein n=1 Tax=Nonomuraea dietziae TaxID=65515 RepID=UPI00340125C2
MDQSTSVDTRALHLPPTIVMVYGPRDREELEVVWSLVQTSYAYATGTLRSGSEESSPRP